ncbi:MAG: sigma-70 family RNA polymerase sigma factor [Chloroflexota bacterium]|nr:sigma-70 family RNA polymerase sigma factor [Chloroflexota bacterium]
MTPELVTRAQKGDRDAFERIAASVVHRLYAMATLIIRDPDAASDAVQESLIEVWKYLPTLRDPDAFDGWVNRILVRSCYRAIRSRRRRRVEVTMIELDASTGSDEHRIDDLDQIDRAFRRLTAEHRAVLVLHHRLGLQLDEAAATLGVPVGTVKSRLNRASASFRAALEAEDREVTLMKGHTA